MTDETFDQSDDDLTIDLGEYSLEQLADAAVQQRIFQIEMKIRTDMAKEIHSRLMPLCVCDNCPDSYAQADIVGQVIAIINGDN